MVKRIIMLFALSIVLTACQLGSSPTSTDIETNSGLNVTQEVTPVSIVSTSHPTATSTLAPTETATPPAILLPESPIYGLQIHDLSSEEQVSLGQQAGVHWTRFDDLNWNAIEPIRLDPPVYHWETVDEDVLKMATESGFEVIGIILFTPEWAQKYPGIYCGPVVEEALDDFAQFMGALVSRYSQPPYNVHYWEIGNEPDIDRSLVPPYMGFGCWGEEDDMYYGGGYYGKMLKAVYPSIKAADPEAQVLVGGLNLDCDPDNPPEHPPGSGQLMYCTPSLFLEGILSSGGGDYFDGISFHAYDYYHGNNQYGNVNWNSDSESTGPVLIKKSRYFNELLARYGYEDKFLINTELALLCGSDGKEPACQTDEFLYTKANYVSQAYAAALAEGLSSNIWYSLTGWRASGLVNSSLQPLEAYDAYKFSASKLSGVVFIREITDFSGVMGYEFTQDDKNIWILWSHIGEVQEIQLPTVPSAVYSVYGETLQVEQLINVPPSPIYLEWSTQ